MGIRAFGNIGECPADAVFRGILVEAGRSELGDVGVGWGQDWSQKSSAIARAASSRISSRTWAYLLRVIAGSEWPSILETVWSGTPCRKARVPAVCRRSWKRTSTGRPASLRNRRSERITESRLRIFPFVFGKTRPGSIQEAAAILSSSCLARCPLSTSTVRGPMWILRSLLVSVVETRVLVRVSAERLTVMEGLTVRSMSSHLRAASSPWRIPVLSARVSRASSRVPAAAPKSLEASSCARRPHRRLLTLDGLLHAAGGGRGNEAVVYCPADRGRENSLHHADGAGVQTLLDLAGLEGAHVGGTQLAQLDAPKERH